VGVGGSDCPFLQQQDVLQVGPVKVQVVVVWLAASATLSACFFPQQLLIAFAEQHVLACARQSRSDWDEQ
jgi:hypothetical protein